MRLLLWAAAIAYGLSAQTTPPQVLTRTTPVYTQRARVLRLQGNVVLSALVTESGRVTDVRVLRPMGFGLDEKAVEALQGWTILPAQRDGQPVAMRMTMLVPFQIPGLPQTNRRMLQVRIALAQLTSTDEATIQKSVQSIISLARDRYAPAMFYYGDLLARGRGGVPRDIEAADLWMQRAADRMYGSAVYYFALKFRDSIDEAGRARYRELLQRAADLAEPTAQVALADAYQNGTGGYPRDLEKAERYFRWCAAYNVSICQLRLGAQLVNSDKVEALAWLELGPGGQPRVEQVYIEAAEEAARQVREALTAEQIAEAQRLKDTLLHTPRRTQ